MDRIVEINLVQSDWLCWLKLKQARVCVWSTVARAEEREKEESTGLAVRANTATAAHLTPRSFTHRHGQRGGHDSAEKQAHLLSMTRLFRGRIPRHSSMPVVCVKGRY